MGKTESDQRGRGQVMVERRRRTRQITRVDDPQTRTTVRELTVGAGGGVGGGGQRGKNCNGIAKKGF